ncbi:hypothetical protein B0H13DRAFT_2052294 [Mycena leptocephala]|nr:hypothetical protein B0H13DRAFT_2052294 [Mycena leptocephala]
MAKNGWVSSRGNLLIWLPPYHRAGFWMHLNTMVMGQKQTHLSYEYFKHGTEWAKCYSLVENA